MASSRAEGRLAAIIAADVAIFSCPIDRHQAGTLAAKKSLVRADAPLVDGTVKLNGDGATNECGSIVDAVARADVIQIEVAQQEPGGWASAHLEARERVLKPVRDAIPAAPCQSWRRVCVAWVLLLARKCT